MSPLLAVTLLAAAPLEVDEAACPPDAEAEVPLLAVVALPGYQFQERNAGFAGALGVEVRLLPWLALRSGYEWRKSGHVIDFLGPKLTPFPHWRVRPFGGLGVAGVFPDSRPGESFLAATVAAGLDVSLGAGFFLSGEGRARFLATGPQASVAIGLGFEFL
jgi:hypothetical protein